MNELRRWGIACAALLAVAACRASTGGDANGGGGGGGGGGSSLPADRGMAWSPGIPGGVPARTTLCATIDAATYGNDATDASAAIQAAIEACPAGQVVYLPPGTYRISGALALTKGITLRGAGPTLTTIRMTGGDNTIRFDDWGQDHDNATSVALTAAAAMGDTVVTVSSAAGFRVGDVVTIDQLDDPAVVVGTVCGEASMKRIPVASQCQDHGASTAGCRSIGQRDEITVIQGNTLTLRDPLHWPFTPARTAQVTRTTRAAVKYAGLEDVRLFSNTGTGYVLMLYPAYSWVKHVETDTVGGVHLELVGCYRCVIRDSYVHHARGYTQGGGSYGISLQMYTSDTLVENNVVYFMNKPFQWRTSGGGNVLGYNYLDDAQLAGSDTQETDVDWHCAHPHMELVEGNWAPRMGGQDTWGSASHITFFRNYASAQHRTVVATDAVSAVASNLGGRYMTYYGNVLGHAGLTPAPIYEVSTTAGTGTCGVSGTAVMYRFGVTGGSCNPVDAEVPATAWRHGNYDFVRASVSWEPGVADHTLPDSLYLAGRPAWWGAAAWPWVDPLGTTRVQTLPAKARFDAETPNG